VTQPLRIFISSPSDVNPERRRAALLIEKLAKDYARFFAISPVLWESEPMLASGHFQDAIVPPSESDIVVLILWSRLGTPLPAQTERREYRGIDGRVPVTGTEWEFEDALQANKQKGLPDLLAYRKKARARAEYSSAAEAEELGRQLQSLEGFWSRYFADRGEFRAAFSTFDDLDQFERRLESDLRSLIERRAAALGETATTSSSAMWLKGSPFRGLQTYQFEHAPIFFGRAEATKMAVERLVANAEGGRPFLLVLGASGAGKSSLTQAGILPALYVRGVVGGVGAWFRAIVRPGAHPSGLFASLAAALTAAHALPELLAGQSVADLANHLEVAAADPSFLIVSALTARENAARDRGDVLPYEQARLVLVVDQLEELFTLGEVTQDLRNRFVLCLQLIRSGRVFVIATMRSDYWHRAAEIPQLASFSDESGRFDLLPATQPEINEMIRRSAEAAGLTFETDPRSEIRLDASLAAEAASEPGSLPLLSFLLDSMYAADIDQEKRSTLTYASMRALGGLKGAIASRAESALLALPLNVQNEFPKVLRALVRGPTRRRAPKARFPEGSPERTIVEALLSPDTRLLIAEGDGEGAQIYLAHEALITNWERATKQIAHDADDFRTLATIEEAEAEYRAAPSHQKRGYLLRDPRLANAINLAARWGNELALELRAFIAKSDAASKAATRRRWAIAALIMICLGALAAASFGAFYVAEAQRNDALIAQSRFLARDSRAATESGDATLGTILAVAALPEKIDSPSRPLIRDAETALAYASYARRELVVFRGHQPGKAVIRNPMGSTTVITGTVYTAAFSPDGTQVISSSSDGTVRIWNPVTGAQIGQLTGPAGAGEIIAAVFSRDGKSILVVPGRRKASIWRLNSDDELIHLIDEDCAEGGPEKIWMGPVPPGRGGFSSDGKRVVTVAYESREACLWDADSGKLIAPLTYEEGQINSLEFSPDGERIMTLAKDNVPTLWDGRTGKMIAEFREPENGIFSAIFSPDSAVIVTPASDGTARIRDARTGKEIMIVRGHDGSVNAAAFSPDSAILATASQDKTVRLWDSKTGVLMKTQRDPRAPVKDAILTHLLPVTSVTFSSDGLHLLTTSNDGTVQIWDAKRGTSSSLIPLPYHSDLTM
jgi:WD40 repeat protein